MIKFFSAIKQAALVISGILAISQVPVYGQRISALGERTFAVKQDGTVWGWGTNTIGEIGDGTSVNRPSPVQVPGLAGVVAVQSRYAHTLALKSDGTVWAWGINYTGQIGDGTTTLRSTPVQVPGLTNVTAVATGYMFSLALKSDGTVWSWGQNSNGQLGDGTITNRLSPVQVTGISNVACIAAGDRFAVVAKSDGTVWCWGENTSGQLGNGSTVQRTSPFQASLLTGITAVSAGTSHGVARKSNGSVWTWGSNSLGQLGDGSNTNRSSPVQISGISSVSSISAGSYHTLAVESGGYAWSWGSNNYGQLGDGTKLNRNSPVNITELGDVTFVAAGGSHSVFELDNGSLWSCGLNLPNRLGDGSTTFRRHPMRTLPVTEVASLQGPGNFVITSRKDGSVWGWGDNAVGQLGDGSTARGESPVQATGISGIRRLKASSHVLALKEDGTLWGWGKNNRGQVGDGSTTMRTSAVQVSGLVNVVSFAVGDSHSLAAKADGTVWAWGENVWGQLGDGTNTVRSLPTQVPGLSNVVAVACGSSFSLALKSDGTVWAWGQNSWGQLGDASLLNRNSPVQVTGLSAATSIAAGQGHSLALKGDGSVWGWGNNLSGQLGDATTTNRSTAVQVAGSTGIKSISAGAYQSLAIDGIGKLWSWGSNPNPVSENPVNPLSSNVPYLVAGGDVGIDSQAVVGSNFCAVVKVDGTILLWGDGSNGLLLNAFSKSYTSPRAILGLNLKNPEPVLNSLLPSSGTVSVMGSHVDVQADFVLPSENINSVYFYADGILLEQDYSEPFSLDYIPASWGNLEITAIAESASGAFSLPGTINLGTPYDHDGDLLADWWEVRHLLNPADASDVNGDPDGDGLTNVQEYEAHTMPNNRDTDGDHFPDGFELVRAGYDPLVFDIVRNVDNDDFDDVDELFYGTNPESSDSDSDGFSDSFEIKNGSDPLDAQVKPFTPGDHFGGAITESDVEPMGNLGVGNYTYENRYGVDFAVFDETSRSYDEEEGFKYLSNQEQWRLKIGDDYQIYTIARPIPQDHSGFRTVNLRPDRVHEVRIENLGVIGLDKNGHGAAPDYNHSWNLKSTAFIPVSSIPNNPITYYYTPEPVLQHLNGFYKSFFKSGVWTPSPSPPSYDWTSHVTYLVPFAPLSYSTSYSGNDATGPRFRKISLFGRPIPDSKPESETESDEAGEDSYVDAFDLSLRHDTSFASIPLAATDLRLEAAASVRETNWSSRGGLRPNEDITSPFGISWSSNLCAYIETVETLGGSTTRPTTLNVVDEGGRSQRFGTSDDMTTFFAWPSSLTDKKTYLNELTKVGDDIVLKKKFGNKLTYRPCDAWFMYSSDRLETSPNVIRHRYWRLAEVEDRFGVKVLYDYGTNPYSLIPVEIAAVGRANQKLTIERSDNGRRINSITDAENNTTTFHYVSRTATVPSTTLSYPYQELASVEFPGGAKENYTYEVVSDQETVNTRVTHHLHANLKTLQRDGYAQRVFTYAFDRTRKWYDHSLGMFGITASLTSLPWEAAERVRTYVDNMNKVPQSGASLRVQYGVPRMVTSIASPAMNIEALFAKTPETQTTYGPSFSSTSGTDVTDAAGKKYTYLFGGTHGEIIDTDSSHIGGSNSVSNQWLVYHSSTTLQYKGAGGSVLGSETFEFDPDSGLSLKRTVDFSGKETVWDFDESRPAGPRITLADNSAFFSKWADPTKKTDALSRVEDYEYGNHRMLKKLTDVRGSVTEYTIDGLGRRTVMTVTDSGNQLLQREEYEYENTAFPAFMTRKIRAASSGGQDLVVEYAPDSRGRLWKETVDPGGENLVTTHTYDLNNRKVTTVDPKGYQMVFVHDNRGRLERVTFASGTSSSGFKTFEYDHNNLKTKETDENGISTLIDRDGLGRIETSTRVIDGDDLVSKFHYDKVSQVTQVIDPRGFATVTLRDELHRPQHVFKGVPEASAGGNPASLASSKRDIMHEEYTYSVAKNTGGGLLNPFKPTGVIRHNAVATNPGTSDSTFTDSTTYDDLYRPVHSEVSYKAGFTNSTHYNYGTVSGGRESLLTTMTDSLGKTMKSTRDGLGREVTIVEGNALTTSKHYTSTGLLWKVVDPLGRETETGYDGAGRAVTVKQPDPGSGGRPVTTTEYDANGNVSAVIDPLGRRTEFDYDSRNRKWRTRQPSVTDATNPGSPSSFVPTTTVEYDKVGNEIAITDTRGSTTRKFYDEANRPVIVRTNPQSGSPSASVGSSGANDINVVTEYDAGGLAISITNGNGDVTRNAYDRLGRLAATACNPSAGNPAALPQAADDPSSYRSGSSTTKVVSYLHDDSGNIIEVTDGEENTTAFTFDGLGRKTRVTWDPGKSNARTETFEFNALLATSREDGAGQTTSYSYDSLHRLEDVTYSSSSQDNRHMTYDDAGKVLSVTYPNDPGSIRNASFTYDALDRLASETSAGVTHTHPEYDKVGNRKKTIYGRTGTTLVSQYDALNRLISCEELTSSTATSGRLTTYAYNRGGKVSRKTLPNNNATTTTYDKFGRTLTMTERTSLGAVVSSLDYSQAVGSWTSSYDAVGNLLRSEEEYSRSGVTDRVVSNTYDHCDRLQTETITPAGGTAVTTEYGYDLADNRVSKTVGTAVTEYRFGNGGNGANSNQLRNYGPAGLSATHTFTYDGNGNRETRVSPAGTDNYIWNGENRLTGVDTPGGDYSYTYDHRGRRIVRDESSAGGALTELTFSGGTSVQEANASGTVQVELIRGSDWGGGVGGVLFTIRSGQRSYNAYNSRGDVVSVTDGAGASTWQATYEAYGTRTDEDGANTERQRANTKDEDPTGLLNEGHRYRDLEAGVFISRDPAGFVDGPNVYAYVRQNPWSAFDPEGLSALDDINSMGDDWFGFWGGVKDHAWGVAKGVGQLAINLDPATNGWQSFSGNKTGYQKIFEGSKQAYSGFVTSAENLGAYARVNERSMVESVLDSASNHVDAAIKDPRKAGGLAFDVVTTVTMGADSAIGIYSRASSLSVGSVRMTQIVAVTEVKMAEGTLTRLQGTFNDLADQQLLPQFRAIDPNLEAGYTGSFKTGKVGNPEKPTFGQAIDLNKFDIDYWIKSDALFQKFGSRLQDNPAFRKTLSETPGFEGLKPDRSGFTIKFKPSGD